MSVKLKITVTKEILEKSKNCEGGAAVLTNCAIALAVRDVFPNAIIGCTTLTFDAKKIDDWVYLPRVATHFIYDFDSKDPEEREIMNPISFDVEVPESVIARIDIAELKPLLENHPTLQLIEV